MRRIPARVRASVFLRSFLIQGSWNYRTMIGGGFAFAILPALRWIYRSSPEALAEAVSRHSEHFNAHPYMAGLALGSTVRLELEEADAEAVRRFKSAVRGPLGGLGDRLVWVGWLPTCLLVGLILVVVSAPAWVCVLTFLGLYNVGHLGFRIWAFRTGWEAGPAVARELQTADLADKTDRIQTVATLLLGLLAGLVAGQILVVDSWGPWMSSAAAVAFVVGARLGTWIWRPVAGGLAVLLLSLIVIGALT